VIPVNNDYNLGNKEGGLEKTIFRGQRNVFKIILLLRGGGGSNREESGEGEKEKN